MTRSRLLNLCPASCSILAMATVLAVGASPAAAQSLQGTGTFTNPGHGSIATAPGSTTVTVNTPQAVIDWTPTDNLVGNFGGINFQPAGTTATFTNSTQFPGNYAVLNRVNVADPSRVLVFNGTINSLVNGQTGGSIYFYSPSGMVFSQTAAVNVGSLVLSASPIAVDGAGNFINNGIVNFGQAPNPNAGVTTGAFGGQFATINALNEGSYVAMVAPRVEHHGIVNVNGGAALVAAEAATINFRPSGLFDIQVNVGTTHGNGVIVDGTIAGPASSGVFDNHRAYLVAVPKNTALTMMIANGADLGFDVAQAANISGNTVILSAGHDISSGNIAGVSAASGADADISIGNANFTSAAFGRANGDLIARAVDGTMTFASEGRLSARDAAELSTLGVSTINVGASMTVESSRDSVAAGASDTGRNAMLRANSQGTINILGSAFVWANGNGGFSETAGINGGAGTGGTAHASATGGNLTIANFLDVRADGNGGFASNANGGAGIGGDAFISATGGGTLSVGETYLSAQGFGGGANAPGTTSGAGIGGLASIFANGGTVQLSGGLQVTANGQGGSTEVVGVNGGAGTGGQAASGNGARVQANGANSVLTVAGSTTVTADGFAGRGGECIVCGGVGGAGTGGDAWVEAFGAASAALTFNADLYMSAQGFGGEGVTGAAGHGQGGQALLQSSGGSSITVVGGASLSTNGYGGSPEMVGGVGGNGTGGTSRIQTFATGGVGGNISITGGIESFLAAELTADGIGGSSFSTDGTVGGNGLGGVAQLLTTGGAIDVDGDVLAEAIGEGGFASLGTGGNGTGHAAEISAINGTIDITGSAFVDTSGYGGFGNFAGHGTGGGTIVEDPVGTFNRFDGATIFARNGSVTIGGSAFVTSDGFGGDAGDGAGGRGGDGAGGLVSVTTANSDLGAASITINGLESALLATADGVGGFGGQGTSGNVGGTGGRGGDAGGGSIIVLASAGNGAIDIANVFASTAATGGGGGMGGNGDGGAGGDGGIGGDAFGGDIQVGTLSGNAQAASLRDGVGNFGSVFMDGSAAGGVGGDGNFGATTGNGGAGGNARSGGTSILVRGSTVNVDSVAMLANASGGNGGAGATTGAGGSATIGTNQGYSFLGGVSILVTNRFQMTQRGQLNAGSITGSAIATGGSGSTTGASIGRGGSEIEFRNSDGTIGSLDLTVSAATMDPVYLPERISVIGGAVDVAGNLSFITNGNMSLFVDNGSLSAGSLVLDAFNFVPDQVNVTPAAPGTVFADTASITTDNDFVTTANFDVGSDFAINAPGLIDAAGMNVAGDLALSATTGITTDDLTATGAVDLIGGPGAITVGNLTGAGVHAAAGGNIGTGAIDSTLDVRLQSNSSIASGNIDAGTLVFGRATGGFTAGDILAGAGIDIRAGAAIGLGNLDAGDLIDLRSNGGISTGNAASDETIYFLTAGQVTSGNLTAGDAVLVQGRAGVTLGNLSAGLVNPSPTPADGYAARVASDGPVVTGTVAAAGAIGFYSLATLTTGSLTSNQGVLAMVNGDMSLGAITTPAGGHVYLADDSMAALGGSFDSFNRAAVLAAFPVATSGSITIGGPVSTGSFQAAAGTSLTTAAINAATFMELSAGGAIATGNLSSAGEIDLDAAGAIAFGNVQADDFNFESGGAVTGGNIVATSHADGEAEGAMVLGDITVSGPPPVDDFSVGFTSATSIRVGNVSGFGQVGFATLGDLTTGDLTAGPLVMTLVGGDITTGAITTTGANSQVYMADASMFLTGGGGGDGDFDENIVLGMAPVATAGSIVINGPVSTRLFRAAAGGNFVANAITAQGFTDPVIFDQGINVSAGGTAAVNGNWTGEAIRITSNDINITNAGSLNTDWAVLTSTNATRTIIGDGVDGEGYRLSDAEYDRIRATGEIEVHANSALGAAPNMIIGDLSVTAPAGSTNSDYEFATSNGESEDAGIGTIRIVGDVTFAGMGGEEHQASFTTGTFQLDAATGLLSLTGDGNALGGTLEIEANHIHVAEGTILDRLAATPRYSGYQDELNAPAAVQRPDGVIRARFMNLELGGGESSSLYVQNTGTNDTPAGFVFSDETLGEDNAIGEDGEFTAPAGSVDVIINGQIQTATGTMTGEDVRDAMVADQGDLTPFTSNSTINGCPLSGGSCGGFQENVPPGVEVAPSQVALLTSDPLGEFEFGNEPDIADGESGDDGSAGSPIEAPQPLFDTRPLTIEGDVDDPISGTGNPALLGTCQDEDGEEGGEDDEGECQ